jgi:hypothetical protein
MKLSIRISRNLKSNSVPPGRGVNVKEEKRWTRLWWGVTQLDQYEGFVKEAKRQDVPDIMELHHENLFRTSHQFRIQLVRFVSLLMRVIAKSSTSGAYWD